MACSCRTVIRSVFAMGPWRSPLHQNRALHSLPPLAFTFSKLKPIYRLFGGIGAREFGFWRPADLDCSRNNGVPAPESEQDQGPPQAAVLKAISEVSKTEGRIGQITNVVIGGTIADDFTNEWLALDQKVNSYPTVRRFTAIGTGGDDFVQAMVVAVESVIRHPIPEGHVRQRVSSRGKFVSVNIGPVQVVSSEQVQAVYNAMRRDDRMKFFL